MFEVADILSQMYYCTISLSLPVRNYPVNTNIEYINMYNMGKLDLSAAL